MSRTKKILLVSCGGALVIFAIVAGILAWFVYENKDEWKAKGTKLRLDGEQAGKTLTESGCLDQAMERYRTDGGRIGEIKVRVWLSGCLETAQPEAAFCSAVPSKGEIVSTVAWRLQTCGRFGFEGDASCANLLTEVQNHCESPSSSKARVNP